MKLIPLSNVLHHVSCFASSVRDNEPLDLSNMGTEFGANGSAVRSELTLRSEFIMGIDTAFVYKNRISRHVSASELFWCEVTLKCHCDKEKCLILTGKKVQKVLSPHKGLPP